MSRIIPWGFCAAIFASPLLARWEKKVRFRALNPAQKGGEEGRIIWEDAGSGVEIF